MFARHRRKPFDTAHWMSPNCCGVGLRLHLIGPMSIQNLHRVLKNGLLRRYGCGVQEFLVHKHLQYLKPLQTATSATSQLWCGVLCWIF